MVRRTRRSRSREADRLLNSSEHEARVLLLLFYHLDCAFDRKAVTGDPKAADNAGGDRRNEAFVPERFAFVDIGYMHFEDRLTERGQCVV